MSDFVHDFRSDTVTRPSAGMRAAMADAEVGDDVYRDDPTTARLEAVLAERVGKQAGLFVPSGTQSNLLALLSHCERGEEYISGQDAHCYHYEAGGAAVLGSIQPQPLVNQPDGTIALADIAAAIKPDDFHFARTRLLALENTIGGQILPADYVKRALDLAKSRSLATHLDGARLFNAAVGSEVSASDLAAGFDSVSVCLSKGLGAPVGTVLLGDSAFIARARRWRKMVGGGMRQTGILAAAGLYALDHNVDRLAEDHANAAALAEGLSDYRGLRVRATPTNMVFVGIDAAIEADFYAHLQASGIGVTAGYEGSEMRWVTHLDVDRAAVDAALSAVAQFFDGQGLAVGGARA